MKCEILKTSVSLDYRVQQETRRDQQHKLFEAIQCADCSITANLSDPGTNELPEALQKSLRSMLHI
jgi:hypothetical protein